MKENNAVTLFSDRPKSIEDLLGAVRPLGPGLELGHNLAAVRALDLVPDLGRTRSPVGGFNLGIGEYPLLQPVAEPVAFRKRGSRRIDVFDQNGAFVDRRQDADREKRGYRS